MPSSPTYRYEALSAAGTPVSGTIDAEDDAGGRELLRQMGLAVRRFEPTVPLRVAPLGGDDLISFNEQLAHLARAGLPVEQGLRLLADDLSRGRLRTAVSAVSRDLEGGATLPQAIHAHRGAFPPLYANLVEAGIRANNLPGVLFNLSKHLDLSQRIRASLSRALAYPVAVIVALVVVSAFLAHYVMPSILGLYEGQLHIFAGFGLNTPYNFASPPLVLQAAVLFGRVAPFVAALVIGAIVLWAVCWPLARGTRAGRAFADSALLRLPLLGPALRFSLVGRWCDATRLGVEAGLDLAASMQIASDVIGSQRLAADTTRLLAVLERGATLADAPRLDLLPIAVPIAIGSARQADDLPRSLASMASLYLGQAEHRARLIPLTLTPILILLIAAVMGMMLAALFIPISQIMGGMIPLISGVSSGK